MVVKSLKGVGEQTIGAIIYRDVLFLFKETLHKNLNCSNTEFEVSPSFFTLSEGFH